MRSATTAKILRLFSLLGVLLLASPGAFGDAHTWDINELFSSADGTIQFVELREAENDSNEQQVNGQLLRSLTFTTHTITLLTPMPGSTANKFLLGGTAAFAALPGAPPLNFTIPDGFLRRTASDIIRYGPPYDTVTYAAGALPLDGVTAWRDGGTTGPNTPTNFAGTVGFVDASPQPPAVPDGTGGSTPMLVTPLDLTGSMLSIAWDTSVCTGDGQHHIIYGDDSLFPASPGNAFGLLGGVCAIGATSPIVWSPVPTAANSGGILWWVIVVTSGAKEGSWGLDSAGNERLGPGTGGSSGQCSVTSLSLSNTCGH